VFSAVPARLKRITAGKIAVHHWFVPLPCRHCARQLRPSEGRNEKRSNKDTPTTFFVTYGESG
jgi:hypothetical protein